jgi:hypothetical protein
MADNTDPAVSVCFTVRIDGDDLFAPFVNVRALSGY